MGGHGSDSRGGGGGLLLLLAIPAGAFAALIAAVLLIAVAFGQGGGCEAEASGTLQGGVPARLVPIYEQAAERYGLGPRGASVLAAINYYETDFGANMGTSAAGALGWMQFLPESWASFGVDGNGDGRKDPYDPWDAIFAAARLLRYSGAPQDWPGAVFSYNHAGWYVAEVLDRARRYQGAASSAGPEAGAACAVAPNEAIARMVAEAARLSAMRPHTEYVWGGSHGISPTPANGPFDCSSAVSHLLQVGGFDIPTMTTVGLHTWGLPGPGRWVTIYDKPFGPEAHTFIEFAPGVTPDSERYWGTSGLFAGHGPGWIAAADFPPEYLAGFERRHPEGM